LEIKDKTNKYLEGYAKSGLRTLLLGEKVISEGKNKSLDLVIDYVSYRGVH
jgi:hypothetical protein